MDAQVKAAVLRRLKSVHGHVGGVVRMADNDAYCIDLLQQIQAVQSALDRVSEMVLKNHLDTCLATAVRGDDAAERERVLGEVVQVFQARSRHARR